MGSRLNSYRVPETPHKSTNPGLSLANNRNSGEWLFFEVLRRVLATSDLVGLYIMTGDDDELAEGGVCSPGERSATKILVGLEWER
jgi:hypothetical protein